MRLNPRNVILLSLCLKVQGAEAEVDMAVAKQRSFDPDLWVIEVEDRRGRHLLDEPGLAD